jgi:hypothetical protein
VHTLFNLRVLVCPEVADDTLHFVLGSPPKSVSYLVTGERPGDLEKRVAALEQNLAYATPARRVGKKKEATG